MTKTLTEQWRDGTLPIGNYYIKVKEQGKENIIEHKISESAFFYDQNVLIEIVDPVPSYDEYKKLKEQLTEANKVIKRELRRQSPKGGVLLGDMNDYLKKWGVR